MKTQLIKDDIAAAAKLIKAGELVAVPTETVYGLAGNGMSEAAVEKIYEVKGRPAIRPLALMVHDPSAMKKYCEDVPPQALSLAKRFWPGPLSIVLKAKQSVPEIVRAGGKTVSLRCPDHPLTLELIKRAGLPLAAPSANPSGKESPKNAESVLNYFEGKIAAVIDGGECGIGTESTIIDMSEAPYKILRRGALSEESIAQALSDELTVFGITGGTGCGKTTVLGELKKLGVKVTVEENTITVDPSGIHAPNEALDGHNDHRIVMSLAVLLTRFGGRINGAQAVSKSMPQFFTMLNSLGIETEEG